MALLFQDLGPTPSSQYVSVEGKIYAAIPTIGEVAIVLDLRTYRPKGVNYKRFRVVGFRQKNGHPTLEVGKPDNPDESDGPHAKIKTLYVVALSGQAPFKVGWAHFREIFRNVETMVLIKPKAGVMPMAMPDEAEAILRKMEEAMIPEEVRVACLEPLRFFLLRGRRKRNAAGPASVLIVGSPTTLPFSFFFGSKKFGVTRACFNADDGHPHLLGGGHWSAIRHSAAA